MALLDAEGRVLFHGSGGTYHNLEQEETHSLLLRKGREVLATGKEWYRKTVICPSNGHRVRITCHRITLGDGTPLGLIGVAVDLTILDNLKDQIRRIEKLIVVDEMAASAAHEIKNPLTAIRAMAQLAQMLDTPEEKNRYLGNIIHEIDYLNGVLRELVNFARPEAGNYAPQDLREVLEGVAVLANSAAQAKHIVIIKDFYQGELPKVYAERSLLRQAFLNLVTNAIEAIPGHGEIRISCYPVEGESMVRVAIQDNGVGISPENIHRVMAPFFTTKERGSGLGLAVTRQIVVEKHEGRFWLESMPGKGTTAFVDLPIFREDTDQVR